MIVDFPGRTLRGALSAKVRLNSGALGMNMPLPGIMDATRFKIKSDVSFARLDVKEQGLIQF